jgi:hypothetical protein
VNHDTSDLELNVLDRRAQPHIRARERHAPEQLRNSLKLVRLEPLERRSLRTGWTHIGQKFWQLLIREF